MRRVLLLMLSLLMVLPLSAAVDPFSLPVGTLIIDAGHGGHDPGASYNWPFAGGVVWERDLNLDIAKRLSVLVKLAHPQLRVIMTREDDTFISLAERSAIAASQSLDSKGALFVSIHINSAQAPSAQGFEILIKRQEKQVTLLDELTPLDNISLFASHSQAQLNRLLNNRNLVIASIFEETMSSQLITTRSRGIKEQDLWVLNQCRMPAVLVEVGFLSNEAEARRLVDSTYRQRVAQVLAAAIERCL